MTYGRASLETEDYAMAEKCIDLSNRLVLSVSKERLLASVRRRSREIYENQRAIELMLAYEEARESGNLAKARYCLESLITLDADRERATELMRKLEKEIKGRVEGGVARGKDLYSQGRIEEALAVWRGLLKADPDNQELHSLITRGNKIAAKIKRLEESVADPVDPGRAAGIGSD